jgi:2-polyprenyl-3-methyl-5-hydroxy-6-metoxy-1,4-benzoquinol methylase
MKATEPKPLTNFDAYAGNYQLLLNDSVSISGEPVEYFAALKARYLQHSFGEWFNGNILDYGCGVGMLSRFLVDAFPNARVDGYDPSDRCIAEIAPAVIQHGSFTSNLAELRSDYSLVVLANVVHHIPVEDRQGVVSDIASRMARGGRLFIFEHNPLNPLTRRSVRLCPFDADAVLLRPTELRRYMTRAGLSVETRDYIVFFPRVLKWLRPLESALKWCALGAQYVMSACLAQGSPARFSRS